MTNQRKRNTGSWVIPVGSVLAVVLLCASIYGLWVMSKSWNYKWGYESMVRESVCEMVHPSALKQPSDCE